MLKKIALFAISISLVSCAATKTSIEKRKLVVNTKIRNSVFLEPTSPEKQIIYLKIRNTSSSYVFDLQKELEAKLQSQGFKITKNPEEAFYMLQANVRQFTSVRRGQDDMGEGALLGAVAGATAGGGSGEYATIAAGSVIGGIASTATNAFVQDVYYRAVVDIQIGQKLEEKVKYKNNLNSSKGIGSKVSAKYNVSSDWDKTETRIISIANQANLEEMEAANAIVKDISNALAGML